MKTLREHLDDLNHEIEDFPLNKLRCLLHIRDCLEMIFRALDMQGKINDSAADALNLMLKEEAADKIRNGLHARKGRENPTLQEVREFLDANVPGGVQKYVGFARERDEVEIILLWRDREKDGSLSPNKKAEFWIPGMSLATGSYQWDDLRSSLQEIFYHEQSVRLPQRQNHLESQGDADTGRDNHRYR